MIDFARAWVDLSLGDQVAVSNGLVEPATGADSLEHRIWRSHNFAGTVAEKIDGPPRAMRIEFEGEGGSLIGFTVTEGEGHSFAPAAITAQLARDLRWEEAKVYRSQQQALPVSIPGVVPDRIVVADADPDSRSLIEGFARGAMSALMIGAPFSLTFTDHENEQFTVDGAQTVQIGNAMLMQFTLCHAASQAVRATLDEAVANGATAGEIELIDITAGYPPALPIGG